MTNIDTHGYADEFIVDEDEIAHSPKPDFTAENIKSFGGIKQDYRPDTTFIIDYSADSKQPGTLTGEICPASDITNNSYGFLASQYPHWRRMLSDDFMRDIPLSNTESSLNFARLVMLHIDDHAWASIVHYMTASKFIHSTDIYKQLYLESGDKLSYSSASHLKLVRQKWYISAEEAEDWQGRKVDTWRRALLAKFAQNEDLQKALILTGWARLVSKAGKELHLLMWVRTVLRGDQQTNQTDIKEPGEEKGITEVFRIMHNLFGKTTPVVPNFPTKEQELSKVEPKHMEIKDAVGYLEQLKREDEKQPELYNKFLTIMRDFRLEKINTPQVLEQVTVLFRGKPWLIRNFLMFLPPEHIVIKSPEDNPHSIYISTPTGGKIIINTDAGVVTHE